jgi:hypothetical protein
VVISEGFGRQHELAERASLDALLPLFKQAVAVIEKGRRLAPETPEAFSAIEPLEGIVRY